MLLHFWSNHKHLGRRLSVLLVYFGIRNLDLEYRVIADMEHPYKKKTTFSDLTLILMLWIFNRAKVR